MYLIRCEASNKIGFGHIRRCMTLAKAIESNGQPVSFIVPESADSERLILEKEGLHCTRIPHETSLMSEVRHYPVGEKKIILDLFHALNRDAPNELTSYLIALEHEGWSIAFIDGMFGEAYREAGSPRLPVVIQPYVGAELDTLPNCEHLLRGSEYVVMDQAYCNAPPKNIRKVAENILVTFGGADPQGITPAVMRILAGRGLPGMNYRVIVGPYFSEEHKAEISHLSFIPSACFELVSTPGDMRTYYDWSDIVLTGSGLSRYECAALGVPMIFCSIYVQHIASSEVFAAAGVGKHLGYYLDFNQDLWPNSLRQLSVSYEERLEMSVKGRQLVDGLGANRLARYLERIMNG